MQYTLPRDFPLTVGRVRETEGSRERVEGDSGCCLICRGGNKERREWMFVGMVWARPSLKYSGARQLGAQF